MKRPVPGAGKGQSWNSMPGLSSSKIKLFLLYPTGLFKQLYWDLIHIAYTIHLFKVYNSVVLVDSQIRATIPMVNSRMFSSPPREPCILQWSASTRPTSLRAPSKPFLSSMLNTGVYLYAFVNHLSLWVGSCKVRVAKQNKKLGAFSLIFPGWLFFCPSAQTPLRRTL